MQYAICVCVEWDTAKAASNLRKHGVTFEMSAEFDWATAVIRATFGHVTGEPRLQATGAIGDRLYVLVYSIETGCTRVISLRKANRREVRLYASES